MAEPFLGEIRMFAGTFAPQGWAFCDGQLLSVSQNDALFSLLGTTYGGDAISTFALPDMRGRVPVHEGQGPGLSPRMLGSKGGYEQHSLTVNQLPSHSHNQQGFTNEATSADPAGGLAARAQNITYGPLTSAVPMHGSAISSAGGGQSHDNIQPFLCIHFIIALAGLYPSMT